MLHVTVTIASTKYLLYMGVGMTGTLRLILLLM